ncbi:hypothetical protein ACQP00_46460 [Dactylosporangium sp. CS-047395]
MQACADAGVRLVAASDAVRASEVGGCRYVREIAAGVVGATAAA